MNREELLNELLPLNDFMSVNHYGSDMIIYIAGRDLKFKFIPCNGDESLIAVVSDKTTIFADYIKLRKDSIWLEQEGGIFTGKIEVC